MNHTSASRYWERCCTADGATRSEALVNVKAAIALYLESLEEHGDPIPPAITEELVEV